MSAEVAGMVTNSSGATLLMWIDLLSLPGSFLLTSREEAALHLQAEGRTIRDTGDDTGDTNNKMMLNHLL